MKLFVSVFIVIFIGLGVVETYSKDYTKKKNNFHSIGAGLGFASLTTIMGDDFNPGTIFYGGYTYNHKALIATGALSYTSFSEFKDPQFDYKSSVMDVSLLGGVYWNILQKDFYEGITPYIGIEGGYSLYMFSEENNGITSTGSITLLTLSPTLGFSVPISDAIAIILESKYRLNLLSQGSFGGNNTITGVTNYNYYTLTAGVKFNI